MPISQLLPVDLSNDLSNVRFADNHAAALIMPDTQTGDRFADYIASIMNVAPPEAPPPEPLIDRSTALTTQTESRSVLSDKPGKPDGRLTNDDGDESGPHHVKYNDSQIKDKRTTTSSKEGDLERAGANSGRDSVGRFRDADLPHRIGGGKKAALTIEVDVSAVSRDWSDSSKSNGSLRTAGNPAQYTPIEAQGQSRDMLAAEKAASRKRVQLLDLRSARQRSAGQRSTVQAAAAKADAKRSSEKQSARGLDAAARSPRARKILDSLSRRSRSSEGGSKLSRGVRLQTQAGNDTVGGSGNNGGTGGSDTVSDANSLLGQSGRTTASQGLAPRIGAQIPGTSNQSVGQSLTQSLQEMVNDQIVRSTRMIIRDNATGEIRLHLKPEHLGDVRFFMQLQDGRIVGRIIVENSSVRDVFEQNLADLEEAFTAGGFESAMLDVSVSDSGDQKEAFGTIASRKVRELDRAVPEILIVDDDHVYVDMII